MTTTDHPRPGDRVTWNDRRDGQLLSGTVDKTNEYCARVHVDGAGTANVGYDRFHRASQTEGQS